MQPSGAATLTEPWAAAGDPTAAPAGRFGRYVIERGLGAGGMGVVVAARDPDLDRAVAIKFLQRIGPTAEAALVAEARAMARLSHPNVVTVHEVLRVGERAGIVMELVEGSTLDGWLAAAPRRWPAIVDVYVQAARGLAAAHRAGLIHRDFKPTNALIDRHGVVRVTDFGLARTDDDDDRTRGGTPSYMAPEVRGGAPADARADQWALGSAATRALADGRRTGGPPPRAIAKALARACADEPADRFADLDALIAALSRARVRPRRWAIGAALLGAAAIGAALLSLRAGSGARAPSCARLAADELGPTWSVGRRADLATAFVRRGVAGAAAWPGTDAALDRQAAAWIGARAATCKADRTAAIAPSLADLRLACLSRRRSELAALVDAAGAPAVDAIGRAQVLALGLTDPALCLDGAALARREPVPDDPALRGPVASLRAKLAAATARAELGEYTAARVALAALTEEARALGWAPLVAEALIAAGVAASGERDHAAAAALLDEGVLVAEAAGHDLATARGLVALVDVRGHGLVSPDDGLAVVPRARAVLTRLGGDPALLAELETHRGRIYMDQARYADALAVFEAVLAERRARAPGRPEIAASLLDGGDALVKLGRPGEAMPRYREAVERRAALFGVDHVLTQRARFSVGNGQLELGDYPAAAEIYRATIASYEAVYGPTHPMLVTPLNNLGLTLQLVGQPAAAAEVFERGLAVATATGADPVAVAGLHQNLGASLRDLGRTEAARVHLERGATDFEASLGPAHPSTVWATARLLAFERAAGRPTRDRLDRAIDAARAAGATDDELGALLELRAAPER